MTIKQIRLGLMATAVIAVSVLLNLLVMQPNDGRFPRPDRNYRGLSGLPGTPSNTVDELSSLVGSVQRAQEHSAGDTKNTAKGGAAQSGRGAAQGLELVEAVQKELANRGYVAGNTTGTLDMVTRAAILGFEYDRGMDLTAAPSIELLAELKSDVPLMPRSPGAVRKTSAEAEGVIRVVQQSLSRLNYRAGAADGVMGQATSGAIRAFERDRQLPETGRVSGLLMMQLAQQGAHGRTAQN